MTKLINEREKRYIVSTAKEPGEKKHLMDDESTQEPEELLNAIRGAREKEKRDSGYVNVCNEI